MYRVPLLWWQQTPVKMFLQDTNIRYGRKAWYIMPSHLHSCYDIWHCGYSWRWLCHIFLQAYLNICFELQSGYTYLHSETLVSFTIKQCILCWTETFTCRILCHQSESVKGLFSIRRESIVCLFMSSNAYFPSLAINHRVTFTLAGKTIFLNHVLLW